MTIETARAAFAEELRTVAHVRSERVISAFATVPREAFLGERPWRIYDPRDGSYWEAPDDPTAAYHNVLFAIDASRGLNNGHPEFWARLLDSLDIRPGDRVLHIGAGTGYYTAVLAELAGAEGMVLAAEIDAALADQARVNLTSRPNVRVVAADGSAFDPGPVDVIVVNAGVTHPLPLWLNALMPGGRMLLPLTADRWFGTVFRIERPERPLAPNRYGARAVSGVSIYPCVGARSVQAAGRLARALAEGGQRFVRSLRLDPHERVDSCWLHGEGHCLSIEP